MIYQLDKIMQDVRICLDQNMTSDALLKSGDIDTLSLNDIIRSKILEAVQRVHRDAPNYLLDAMKNSGYRYLYFESAVSPGVYTDNLEGNDNIDLILPIRIRNK